MSHGIRTALLAAVAALGRAACGSNGAVSQGWRHSREARMRTGIRVLMRVSCTAATLVLAACAGNGAASASEPAPNREMLATGETLFFQCIACHTTGRNEPHLQGPNLWGIFGAEAGTQPAFPYSEALRKTELVWTDEAMDRWLQKPSEFIPGNLMAYIGMPAPDDRRALIAYLKSQTGAE